MTFTMSTSRLLPAIGLVLLLVLAALSAAPGANAQAATRTIVLEAHDNGATEYWFTLENQTARNPTIMVNASETVTFRLINKGTLQHNLHIDPTGLKKATAIIGPNATAEITVTFPNEDKTVVYRCDPHAGTMKGQITIQGASGGGGNGGSQSPGFEVVALLGAIAVGAFLLRRK